MPRIALIYNFAQHYRANIFSLMDKALDIDFIFGDHYLNVKKMDYSLLQHKVTEVRNIHIGSLYWQTKVIGTMKKGYDKFIILGEPMCLSTWCLLILGRLKKKEIFLWTHGWYGKESPAKKFIKKNFFGLATGTMTYGNYARNLMIENGLNADKITVIHNSLMYDEQLPIRAELEGSPIYSEHFKNDFPNVIFIGRLTAVKKLDQLLNAMLICKERGFYFNTIFVGDGVMKTSLQRYSIDFSLQDNVWFYGECYDEKELSSLLYNADLCVAPGNIGLTAMHAMSYGCPCVSHNDFPWQMPEFEAIIDGVTGTFFDRDDVGSLATAIQSWLESHKNDREHIRHNCFNEIDSNWNPHVQLELIKKAINY